MSVLHCDICDSLVDTDYEGCEDNPEGSGDLICGNCLDEFYIRQHITRKRRSYER